MRSQNCLNVPRSAWFARFYQGSTWGSFLKIGVSGWSWPLQRLVALGMALVLLPLAEVEAFAQQGQWQTAPQYAQYPQSPYQQNAPYSGQYAPGQQPGYAQPGYGRQLYASPQQYQGQPYSQQPDSGPSYAGAGPGYDQPGYAQPDNMQGQAGGQAFTAEQLEEMLAPVALYPDALLAEVLAAATYPAQVSVADHWLRAQGNASADQIAAGANAQSWDPSVKALTAFPQVLAQMDQNLAWTTDLGNAYYNQPQDVMQTVQVLRQRAQNAGTLQNTPQEQMSYDQGNIELAPPDPQMVYVPQYNPWNVYGAPLQPYPGFSLLDGLSSFFGSSLIQYGLGIGMSAFMHTGFSWLSWALDWFGNSILFNHSSYYSHSTSVARWNSPGRGGAWGRGMGQRDGYGRSQYGQSQGGYGRQSNEYRRYSGGNERGYARPSYGDGGSESYRGSAYGEGYGHTYSARPGYESGYGTGYGNRYRNESRPAYQNYAYNRPAERPQTVMPVRPQQSYSPYSYARPGYGSGFYGQSREAYGGRVGGAYANPQQSWRGAEPASRSYKGFEGKSFEGYSAKPQHSGGFHMFGGGGPKSSYGRSFGGGKAPKSFGGGKHSGGGGGHSSSHGGWGHHH